MKTDLTNSQSVSSVTERKFSVREAAAFLRLSKSFLDKSRLDGTGPQFLKLGRRVIYDIRDLEGWALRRRRQHTSEVFPTNKVGIT